MMLRRLRRALHVCRQPYRPDDTDEGRLWRCRTCGVTWKAVSSYTTVAYDPVCMVALDEHGWVPVYDHVQM